MVLEGVERRGVCPPILWLVGVSSQRDLFLLPPWGVGVSVTDSLWGVSAHPVWVGVSPANTVREGLINAEIVEHSQFIFDGF